MTRHFLEMLSSVDIKASDYKYLPLIEDYETMLEQKQKVTFIVAVLSQRYHVSESTVYRVIRRFYKTVKV